MTAAAGYCPLQWLQSKTISRAIALSYPSDCTTTRDHLKMVSNTESELEDEVEETEQVGPDVMIVESVNAKGKSKESAVWLYFETTEERSGSQSQAQHVANCKE